MKSVIAVLLSSVRRRQRRSESVAAQRSSSDTTSCKVGAFEINCGMTYSATVLRIQRIVVEYVVPQFISSPSNESWNDAFRNCSPDPEDSCGMCYSATYFVRKETHPKLQIQQNSPKHPTNPSIYHAYLKYSSNVELLKDDGMKPTKKKYKTERWGS